LLEPVANASYSRLLQGGKYSIEAHGASRKAVFDAPDKIHTLVVTGGAVSTVAARSAV
jgi:hypothetical protein